MSNSYPKHLLKGITYLDIINLENRLAKSEKTNSNENFFIDLSQIRRVELSAVAQLTLFIADKAKTINNNIYIALPTITLTIGEHQSTSASFGEGLKWNLLETRKQANNFLKTIGFVKVINKIAKTYENDIRISENYDFEESFDYETFEEAFSGVFKIYTVENYDYKYIYPLEWIDCKKGLEQFELIENRIDKILGNSERGLDSLDVQALKNVILSELIKNVNEHSKSKYALFTIGLMSTASLFRESEGRKENEIEKDYINWLKNQGVKSQVEIYFGDCGCGILSDEYRKKYQYEDKENKKGKRDDEKQLELAFQRWTTLKKNTPRIGTKGLYRIQRIVNKYNGIFHISTGKLDGGFQKGGLKNSTWLPPRKSNYFLNGTLIQIKMCPYAEAKDFRFNLENNDKVKNWKTIQYNYKSKSSLINFKENFEKEIQENENLLIIFDLKRAGDVEVKEILEETLYDFSFESHPCSVVVYLLSDLKNDTVQTSVESVNIRIKEKTKNDPIQDSDKDGEVVCDPILIIGNNNNAFWCGGNQELIALLNESYQNKKNKLSDIDSYKNLDKETRDRIRLHLENDNKLVNVDNDENIVFNFTNIDSCFEQELRAEIEDLKLQSKTKYCTPKLEIVDYWLDIKSLMESNAYGYALSLYLNFKIEVELQTIDNQDTYVLIDSDQSKELAKAFASLYGVNQKNIINLQKDVNTNIPKRIKLFPPNSNVIIITSIISSSETIRRLVKYAKRDLAKVLAILTLCNYRKTNISTLTTWDETTPIISVFEENDSDIVKNEPEIEQFDYDEKTPSISPNFENEKKLIEPKKKYKIENELRAHIIEKKALHYNHIGIYKDRHFSFYLDKEKVLKKCDIIWTKIEDSINKWKTDFSINDFTIYVPENLINGYSKKSSFINFLETLTPIKGGVIHQLPDIIEYTNFVYLDFGIISGNSINKVIKSSDVRNLFICILFDQSRNNDIKLYQKIRTLNRARPKHFDSEHDDITFQIKCLFNLPLNYYNSESCPICEHRRSLDKYKLNQEYMSNFSEDRQKRLTLIDSAEIITAPYPYDFYYDNTNLNHELSSELIMKMFEFKNLLEQSELYTQYRIRLYSYVYDIYENIESYKLDSTSELYAMIYYLAHEINWLQKDPLVFRRFRRILAEISKNIATTKLDILSEELENTSKSDVTAGYKLAVRYKYAAISLLRSADKYKFCESISEILTSSYSLEKQSLSDNLTQNTLYHISSLLSNKYNKSKKYFEKIETQLNSFEQNKNIKLSVPQKVAFEKITNLNKQTLKELGLLLKGDLGLIIQLKNEKCEHYESTRHPYPNNCLSNMALKGYDSLVIENIRIYKEKSEFYGDFLMATDNLVKNWERVCKFIDATIKAHTINFSDKIIRSKTFQNMYFDKTILNTLIEDNKLGITDEFSILVYEINNNPLYYITHKAEYDITHNIILGDLISQDSIFFKFLDQFPANLKQTLEDCFETKKFFKTRIINTEIIGAINIFYPRDMLNDDFDFIIQNINGKLNTNCKIEDVLIDIHISQDKNNKYIIVTINYNLTNEYNTTPSDSGSLAQTQKEMDNYGGELTYDTQTDSNGLFSLKFKYLKYV